VVAERHHLDWSFQVRAVVEMLIMGNRRHFMKRAFVNGKFYLSEGSFAQAVISENGKFTHVGSNDEIHPLTIDAEIIDMGGHTVLPGFNDSHLHLYNVGVMRSSLNLMDATSIADCITAGQNYIAQNGIASNQPIFGRGWNQDYFTDRRPLTRHDLDKISTAHPIVATRACGHLAAVNSLALKLAGIHRNTPDVPGGEIRKDESGEPTGVITENALELLNPLKPTPSVEDMAATIKTAMEYAASHGITSVQTNDLRNKNWQAMLDAYNLVYSRKEGTLRTYHQCCFTDIDGLRDFIAAGQTMGQGNDMHKIGPIKMFVDGSLGAHTAAMRLPYNDNPNTTGVYCMTVAQLDEMVKTANASGFGCVIHAIGDGAIDMVLTAYEKMGVNNLRNGIIHCQITDLPLLERFKATDVLALVQPIFLHYDMKIVESRVGKELASTSYAFNTMDKLGIHTSYGTDAPIEDLNTINNIHCAVNRQDLKGEPTVGYNSVECVSLARAIDNYTIESAYASFDENKKGRIAPDFLADMCVLDKDIFAIDPSEIKFVKVNMTILGGDIVYRIV